MDAIFSLADLQHLVAIKLVFFAFLAVSAWGVYTERKPAFFVWVASIATAAAYYLLVNDLELSFWGLTADELTIAAMYQQFAHGSLASDFAYAGFVPFYPSLFFQFFGLAGRLLDLNGVQIAKFAVFFTFLLFPPLLYFIQKIYWTNRRASDSPRTFAWVLGAGFVFLFAGWDAVITKPYELVSAVSVILWSAYLLHDVYTDHMTTMRTIAHGVLGGLLFWMFYFWFFLAAIGIALFNFFQS